MNQSDKQRIRLSSGAVFHITPDFLNSVLEAWIAPDQVLISSVRREPLIGGDSFNATLLRLYLTYDQPPTTAPQTLIAKLPTPETELHERAMIFQPGSRENWFYRSGAARSPMSVPHCYLNESDRSSGESVLLLEDLAPASPGSWLVGATLDQAELALASLARLHAHWWGQDSSEEIQELNQLLSGNSDDELMLVQELYDSAWPQFVSQIRDGLPDDVRCFGEAILGNMKMVDDLSDLGPPTLVHGDYRLDNMLFGKIDGGSICWVLDWEDVFFGSGMIDVTWFLGGCLPVEHSHHESDLLRQYHQTLIDLGVKDYPWEQCYDDYRRNMCSSFVQGILSATLDGDTSKFGQQLAHVISERFIAVAERLKLRELLNT